MYSDIEEGLLNEANILINSSDIEIMALSLGSNENAGDNYQMAMNIRLKRALNSLNVNITSLKKSMAISSWVMGMMTFLILILTGLLAWKGF